VTLRTVERRAYLECKDQSCTSRLDRSEGWRRGVGIDDALYIDRASGPRSESARGARSGRRGHRKSLSLRVMMMAASLEGSGVTRWTTEWDDQSEVVNRRRDTQLEWSLLRQQQRESTTIPGPSTFVDVPILVDLIRL
jgi:hypothetical protein